MRIEYNIPDHYKGNTFDALEFTILDDDGLTPIDLTDATIKSQFRRKSKSGKLTKELNDGSGITLNNDLQGEVEEFDTYDLMIIANTTGKLQVKYVVTLDADPLKNGEYTSDSLVYTLDERTIIEFNTYALMIASSATGVIDTRYRVVLDIDTTKNREYISDGVEYAIVPAIVQNFDTYELMIAADDVGAVLTRYKVTLDSDGLKNREYISDGIKYSINNTSINGIYTIDAFILDWDANTYYYDIKFTFIDGKVITYRYGIIKIIQNITV